MTGFILAAGFGTRLKPLTSHIPKALVPLCGIPLFKHACSFLQTAGISNIGANAHHLAESIMEFSAGLPANPVIFHEKEKILGTGGSLLFARDFLSRQDTFCVINADIITDVNLAPVIAGFNDSNCIAALVAAPVTGKGTIWYRKSTFDYAGVPTELTNFEELAPADFVGIALYKKEFLQFLRADDFSVTPIWKRAIGSGKEIRVYLQNGIYWNDLGTPEMLAKAHFDFLDGRITLETSRGMKIDKALKRAVSNRCVMSPVNSIGPYTWCGKAEIGENASIEQSIILDGAIIPPGSRIRNAIVTPWEEINFA